MIYSKYSEEGGLRTLMVLENNLQTAGLGGLHGDVQCG